MIVVLCGCLVEWDGHHAGGDEGGCEGKEER